MASGRLSEEDRRKLELLSQTKQRYESQRLLLVRRMVELDLKVLETQAAYNTVYNENAPIVRLPVEITRQIFSFSLAPSEDEDHPVDEDQSDDSSKSPKYLMEVIVSHVCHRWRSIALAFPALWSSFCYDGPESRSVPVGRLSAYLERSGTRGLELWLDFGGSAKDGPRQCALLQKVTAHVARWKRVTIFATQWVPLNLLPPLLGHTYAPNLEYLAMSHPNNTFIPYFRISDMACHSKLSPMIFTQGAPKLKYLWMDGWSAYFCLPPPDNLTTLRIERDSQHTLFAWDIFLTVLAIPSLENLSLLGSIFHDPTTSTLDIISMNHLQHLRFSNNDYLNYVLFYLRAPRLETIVMRNTHIGGDENLFPTSAEPYFFPSLKELVLIEATVAQSTFPFTDLFSSVQDLVLSYQDPIECILHHPTDLHDPNIKMWPNLEVITCHYDLNYEDPSYITWLADIARWRASKPITYRIRDRHVQEWQDSFPSQLELLKSYCNVEELKPNAPLTKNWPATEESTGYISYDPFAIRVYL